MKLFVMVFFALLKDQALKSLPKAVLLYILKKKKKPELEVQLSLLIVCYRQTMN